MAKKKKEEPEVKVVEEVKEEPVVEEVKEEPVVDAAKTQVAGKVVNCKRLFVRSGPDFSNSVVTVISEGDIVKINKEKSVEDFYAVSGDGFSGFCSAPYISVIY